MSKTSCLFCDKDIEMAISAFGLFPIVCPHCKEEIEWTDIALSNQVTEKDGTEKETPSPVELVEVNIEVDEDVLAEVEKICEKEGYTVEQAVEMFLRASIARRGIPFPIRLP